MTNQSLDALAAIPVRMNEAWNRAMQLFVIHWPEDRWQVIVVMIARIVSFEYATQLDALGSGH